MYRRPVAWPADLLVAAQYGDSPTRQRVSCSNVPWLIAYLVGYGAATIPDLRTRYTVEDAYNLLEIIQVTEYNRHGNSN